MTSEQFGIGEQGIAQVMKIRRSFLIRYIFIGVLSVIGIMVYTSDGFSLDYTSLAIIIVVQLVYFLMLRRGGEKHLQNLRSYKLTITDTEVICEQNLLATIIIPKPAIKSVVRDRKGNLAIMGQPPYNNIAILSQTEGIERIAELLGADRPIEAFVPNRWKSFGFYLAAIMIFLGFSAFGSLATPKVWKIIAGLSMLVALLWMFIQLKNSPQKRLRWISWFVLYLFLCALLGVVTLLFFPEVVRYK